MTGMAAGQPSRTGRIDPIQAESCDACGSCATVSQLSRRLTELEKWVSTDYLTGLWNRAHFNHVVASELDRSLRYRQPVSLILFDIDHFKRVNDCFGHQAGDAVLREIAIVANAVIRSSDSIFRWGGEEFSVLATSTGHRGAARLSEALRSRVASHVFPAVGTVSISLGVVEHLTGESAEELFRRADTMLYAAKREGRNCVRIDARGNSDAWSAAQGPAGLSLTWQEAYECGEASIDREHQELFSLANDLINASAGNDRDAGTLLPVFDRLLDHIASHFSSEEALLERHGYARLDSHRRAHASLLGRARELRAALAKGEAALGSIVDFLAGEVVAQHLFKADRSFFPLFRREAADEAGS